MGDKLSHEEAQRFEAALNSKRMDKARAAASKRQKCGIGGWAHERLATSVFRTDAIQARATLQVGRAGYGSYVQRVFKDVRGYGGGRQ